MSEDKELFEVWRAEFERDIKPHFNPTNPDYNSHGKNGDYFYAHMNLAWTSYLLAKRSQPIVVLPMVVPIQDGFSGKLKPYFRKQDILSALTAAGIKYTIGE